ncbi:TonB-dependent receptor domain-containing protein [Algibacter lectus]|uniref:TonB-dependent receptor domain-containing protein n=1 Tax=Algibacter lectus TaxID=221126 RepID=UPI002493DF5A|nr:TonB-dependent receptor [Algibacter lectus]
MTKLFYTLLCVFSVSTMFAQTDIKGTVKDNSGVPVTGANVLIEGSSSGATTDFDGNYSFTTSVSGAQKIIVSFLGYETLNKTVTLSGGAMTLDFVMVEGGNTLDEVVLTASSTFRSQKETPNSISSLKAQELTRLNANSQADIVASIPGIVADGGGGEAATNIFVRGLPSGGQNDFSPIQYDGLTLAGYGLSSTAGDVYAKVDQGVKGVEFVRGGSSILYGAGSTAGVMNYISKTGDTNDENIINFEVATKGRVKGEFYSGGKVGGEDSNTYYAVSGFVRKDDGPLDFGLPTKGYQFRGNLKKKFENGSFTFYTQFIDDKAQFLLGLPLDGDSRERITGNDGETVYQLNSSHVRNISFLTPAGEYKSPIGDGVHTKGFYAMGVFDYDLGNDWKINSKVKVSDYVNNFGLYVAASGTVNTPANLSDYLDAYGYAGATNINASYVGGTALAANDRVIDNLNIDRNRPITDLTGEFSITKKLEGDKVEHNITLGTYLTSSQGEDNNWQYRTLSAFNDAPELVNLSFTDVNGNDVILAENGLTARIGRTAATFLTQDRTAFYLTDEMVLDRWRIDVGFRVENQKASREIGTTATKQVYNDVGLTSALQNVGYATGEYKRAEVSTTGFAASLAALYKINDNLNAYANMSKGYFFPLTRSINVVSNDVIAGEYNPENIYQVETGLKYGSSKFSGTFAAYYTTLVDRVAIQRLNYGGTIGTVDGIKTLQDTKTLGMEVSWLWKFAENLSFNGNFTYQGHELKKDERTVLQSGTVDGVVLVEGDVTNGANVGKQLRRQPTALSTLRFDYDNKKLDAFASANIRGSQFNDDANLVELDGFTVLRIGAGYTIGFEDDKKLRLGFSVYNLADSQGLSEGDPRAFSQSTTQDYFVGRPILPRRAFFNATLTF